MKYLTLLLLLTALLLAGCTASETMENSMDETSDEMVDDTMAQEDEETMHEDMDGTSAEPMENTQGTFGEPDVSFILAGENFKYMANNEVNPTLTVKQGDVVRVEFFSKLGFHDWVVDEFDAATVKVNPEDGIVVVEFIADQVGEFEYYCSVGSHRANGMFGMFIVEPAQE